MTMFCLHSITISAKDNQSIASFLPEKCTEGKKEIFMDSNKPLFRISVQYFEPRFFMNNKKNRTNKKTEQLFLHEWYSSRRKTFQLSNHDFYCFSGQLLPSWIRIHNPVNSWSEMLMRIVRRYIPGQHKSVLRIRIHRIHTFSGLPDPDPLVRGNFLTFYLWKMM